MINKLVQIPTGKHQLRIRFKREEIEMINTVRETNYISYRKPKFFKTLYKYHFPWNVNYTLIELFPVLEHYFNSHHDKRTNFFNLDKVLKEMLQVINYPQYSKQIICNKAKHKQIKKFVNDAVNTKSSNISLFKFNEEHLQLLSSVP